MSDRLDIGKYIDYFNNLVQSTFSSAASTDAYIVYYHEYMDYSLVLMLSVLDSSGRLKKCKQEIPLKILCQTSIPDALVEEKIQGIVNLVTESLGEQND